MVNLRANKVEIEASLGFKIDTIKVLEQSNDQKSKAISDLEQRLTAAMQKIEDKTLKVKEAQQRENQMRMV